MDSLLIGTFVVAIIVVVISLVSRHRLLTVSGCLDYRRFGRQTPMFRIAVWEYRARGSLDYARDGFFAKRIAGVAEREILGILEPLLYGN